MPLRLRQKIQELLLELKQAKLSRRTLTRIVDLNDLIWDAQTCKPYVLDPDEEEFSYLRQRHKDWLDKFEPSWMARHQEDGQWNYRAFRRAWERLTGHLEHRSLPSFREAQDAGFAAVLDQLYAIRDGKQYFGKQNLTGGTNTTLEYRRGFTSALVAVAKAYGCEKLIETPSVRSKIDRNLGLDGKDEAVAQLYDYDPVIKFLFPDTLAHLTVT